MEDIRKRSINIVRYYLLKNIPYELLLLKLERAEVFLLEEEVIDIINYINETSGQYVPIEIVNNKIYLNYEKRTYNIQRFDINKKFFKIMVTSDKHFDHRDLNYDYLDEAYDEAINRGVDFIFDLGDILNGPKEMVFNKEKVKTGTLDGSIESLRKNHPYEIPTYFITGNHDLMFMYNDGCNIGKVIEEECKNIIFINDLFSPIEIGNFRFNISHGSIEHQKLTEIDLRHDFEFLKTNRPHMICQGHFHCCGELEQSYPYLYQIPSLKTNGKNKKGSQFDSGVVFLEIYETSKAFEVEQERVSFESKAKQKSQLVLKKRR